MTNYRQAFARLDQFVEQKMRATNLPGVAIALTDRQKLLRVSTYGYADLAAQTPVTPETLFEIGSIGKSFTSIALLQQHDAGRFAPHEPLARHLPWFKVQSAHGPITAHHLMSHTAGLSQGPDWPTDGRYEVWDLCRTETGFLPGERFYYSNAGYKALGILLEDLAGQRYGDIIQSQILDPLSMTSTAPVITHETRKRLAVGYQDLYDDRPSHPTHPLVVAPFLELTTGDGCIASTPTDMAKYVRMLINRGCHANGRILSEKSFQLLTQHAIKAQPGTFKAYDLQDGASWGYGLLVGKIDGHTHLLHGGSMPGYMAAMIADTDHGLGAVVLVNGSTDPAGMAVFSLKLLRAALNGEEPPAFPPLTDPSSVDNAQEYAGTFEGDQFLTLLAREDKLILQHNGERVALEPRGPDTFYVPHADFSLFLLRFGRQSGTIVEAFHGPNWYVNDRYTGPAEFDYPAEWTAYPGHYRSHNPWFSNFRVVLRKGALALIAPPGGEETLEPLGNGTFCLGEAGLSPERIHFDTIVDGQALHACHSRENYYRTFTP